MQRTQYWKKINIDQSVTASTLFTCRAGRRHHINRMYSGIPHLNLWMSDVPLNCNKQKCHQELITAPWKGNINIVLDGKPLVQTNYPA